MDENKIKPFYINAFHSRYEMNICWQSFGGMCVCVPYIGYVQIYGTFYSL